MAYLNPLKATDFMSQGGPKSSLSTHECLYSFWGTQLDDWVHGIEVDLSALQDWHVLSPSESTQQMQG